MLYPSILTGSLDEAQDQLDSIRDVPGIEVFQIDVVDGQFADNLTITPLDLIELEYGSEILDLHLMTEEPMDFLYETTAQKQRLPIRGVIAQVERMSLQEAFLEEVAQHQWLPGLSLDLYTPLEAVDESSWPLIKLMQIMTIEAGFQGQELRPLALKKIAELVTLRQEMGLEFEIIADGGVKLDNLEEVLAVGAESVTVGSAIWKAENRAAAAAEFVSLV